MAPIKFLKVEDAPHLAAPFKEHMAEMWDLLRAAVQKAQKEKKAVVSNSYAHHCYCMYGMTLKNIVISNPFSRIRQHRGWSVKQMKDILGVERKKVVAMEFIGPCAWAKGVYMDLGMTNDMYLAWLSSKILRLRLWKRVITSAGVVSPHIDAAWEPQPKSITVSALRGKVHAHRV